MCAYVAWCDKVLLLAQAYLLDAHALTGSKNLYQAVLEHNANPKLYEGQQSPVICLPRNIFNACHVLIVNTCDAVFGLERKFADRYSMLCIHMWMLLVRLRSEGKDGKDLAQMMYEAFQENVEARVRAEGVKVRACYLFAIRVQHMPAETSCSSCCI